MAEQPKDYADHLHEPTYEAASPQMRCAVCHESGYRCTCPCEGEAPRESDDEQ